MTMDLSKKSFEIKPIEGSKQKLRLKFVSVDTDELKDTIIEFDGNLSLFKVGEGDNNQY